MAKVVKLLSMTVETPIMIDSTEANVIERALEAIPGRAIINSINMENGRERIDAVVPLAKKHGAALVALTIDPIGMAKTRERKLEVAKKIYDIVVGEYGLAAEDLIYDDLTFTLATGDAEWIDSAIETIEGIRLIKRELPGVFTSLGVSNVSFGLAPEARAVLNSVFLHHCVEAGLDMAIVNPAHVQPYAEISGGRARAGRRSRVQSPRPTRCSGSSSTSTEAGSGDAGGAAEKEDPTAGMTPDADACTGWSCTARKTGSKRRSTQRGVRESPVRVLNEVLLPAMKEVGDKFGAGELILPFVLQSAEVMKKAVKHLEQFLERAEGYTKGKVVLATVYGDVHDIGKSLVNTILSNNGYTVFDLGKQVPVNTIIDKAIEVDADAIGLSALLVSTSKQMPLCVQELDRRGHEDPGADRRRGDQSAVRPARAVRRRRARVRAGRLLLQGRVRGTGDDGSSPGRRAARRRSSRSSSTTRGTTSSCSTNVGKDIVVGRRAAAQRSDVTRRQSAFRPRRSSARARCSDIPLDEVFALLDLDELYRLQWGGRGSGPEYEATVRDEFEPTLARLKEAAKRDGWLQPRAVYGFFPVQAQGNDLVVYDPDGVRERMAHAREIARFHFPRQEGRERLCIADYFRSVESGGRRCRGVPGRDGRRRGDASGSRRCRAPANTPRRSTCTASPSKRRRRSPSGCTARFVTSSGSGRPGEALLVGLRRLSGSRGSRAAVQDPAGRARARHGAHERVPADSRAEHGGDHRASPAGEVLRGARRGG